MLHSRVGSWPYAQTLEELERTAMDKTLYFITLQTLVNCSEFLKILGPAVVAQWQINRLLIESSWV